MIGRFRTGVPSPAELRATVVAARWWLKSARRARLARAAPGEPDDTLLGLVADPYESVADATVRLREVEQYLRQQDDRRSVFLTVYAEMTARVKSGLESGLFEDTEWVRTYLVSFANRYRRVLFNFEQGALSDVPTPWAIGFIGQTSGSTLLLQDALLGINAHINYDLPYTLRDVTIDPNRSSKRRDHIRINDVLHQLIDVVQQSLVSVYGAEGYRDLDRGLGDLDEQLTLIGLREARELAWRNAVGLVDTRWAPLRRLVRWRVRLVSTGGAAFILAPSADPRALSQLRTLERDGPPIEALLEQFRVEMEAATIDIS